MLHTALSHVRFRGALATLVSAALSVSLLAPPAHAAPSASPAAEAGIPPWSECRDGFQCAEVPAPLDYGDPKGEQIGISVIRLPAGDPSQRVGSLMLNPGGPGGSGLIYSVLGGAIPNGAGDAYDWIGFDPRGVGSSVPSLSCDPDYANGPKPEYIPWNREIEQTWLTKARNYTEACDKAGGDLLDHVTTVDSATKERKLDTTAWEASIQQVLAACLAVPSSGHGSGGGA